MGPHKLQNKLCKCIPHPLDTMLSFVFSAGCLKYLTTVMLTIFRSQSSCLDGSIPHPEEVSCPIEGIWEHVPIPIALAEQETFVEVESFRCTPNIRNRNHNLTRKKTCENSDAKSSPSIELSTVDPNTCETCREFDLQICANFCCASLRESLRHLSKDSTLDDCESDPRDQESATMENQQNSAEDPSERSIFVVENPDMGGSIDSLTSFTSGSASTNEESQMAANSGEEGPGDIYESLTLVAENPEIIESINSHQFRHNDTTLASSDAIDHQETPELVGVTDIEIQADSNVIGHARYDYAAQKNELDSFQRISKDVQEDKDYGASRSGQAEVDDGNNFKPLLWKFLSWVTLLSIFLHCLQATGLLKFPINEVHIESPDFSGLRSIQGVGSEYQKAFPDSIISLDLKWRHIFSLPTIAFTTQVPDAPKCEGWMEEYIQSVIMLPEPTSSPYDALTPEPAFEQPAPISKWFSVTEIFNAPYKVAGWGLGVGSAWVGWQQRGLISAWWR